MYKNRKQRGRSVLCPGEKGGKACLADVFNIRSPPAPLSDTQLRQGF